MNNDEPRGDEQSIKNLDVVLEHLRDVRAFDFTGYRRATLGRRIEKRMQTLGMSDPIEYVDYLEVHPQEFEPLVNTILINVTSFFRDREAWDVLRTVVVPELVARRPNGPYRVWSAGCSSGQEAFSVVMLFAEQLGVDRTRDHLKVYATDVDEEALQTARSGTFRSREMESLPPELASKYFQDSPLGLAFQQDLRRTVIFGRHDLLQDAPISRIDLLLCRNTLMYFNTDVQNRVVHRLHFSLADGGYLMLGKVEMLLGQSELFDPVDQKRRVFRKRTVSTMRSRLLALAGDTAGHTLGVDADRLLDAAFEQGASPQIVVDPRNLLVAVNAQARETFGIPDDMVGRPFQDLEVSYRPVELRSAIEQARSTGRFVGVNDILRWAPNGEMNFLDISVTPLLSRSQQIGVLVSFVDVTAHRQVQEELEHTHRELEVAHEELQSTNEELETTNEELQSTIEELETTNEELQSSNEELETMNEELSSANEELQAMNDELRERTAEIDQVNAYLESVLSGLRSSVVVVDTELFVRVWNGRSFDMWGLRPDEAEGRQLLSLDIGFPLVELRDALLATMAGGVDQEPLQAVALTRRGREVHCTAVVRALRGADGDVEGAIILIDESHV